MNLQLGSNEKELTHSRRLVLAVGCCLALVSMAAEIQLFVSYAISLPDKLFAGITALALVACQFIFVGLAIDMLRQKHFCLSALLALVTLVLFIISVSGTAAFFESRFTSVHQANRAQSDVYQLQLKLIEDLTQQENIYKSNALALKKVDKVTRAGLQIDKAVAVSKARASALLKLEKINATPTNAGSALVALMGEYRWLVWYVLAGLVDVCALLCFSVLAVCKQTQTQKVKKQFKKTAVVQIKQYKQTQTDKLELAEKIKQDIIGGVFGDSPGVRRVMEAFNVKTHSVVAGVFGQLEVAGQIKRHANGRTWLLV
ncbi:MAG: hypothetical protein V7785_08050 [Bermanella sp.]